MPAPHGAIDHEALSALAAEPLDWRFKAVPVSAWGTTIGEFLAGRPRLSDLGTPLLTLDAPALDANLAAMVAYCADAGVELAPHGKTTMAPELWSRQLAAGARGITVANVPQLRVGRAFGVRRLYLANALVDPAAIRWISAELDADPAFGFSSWVDSRRTVALMDEALRGRAAQRPIDVFVELGAPGGRTGARSITEALDVAEAIAATPALRLIGVAGYEGVVAHDASPESLQAVRDYLQRLAGLHSRLLTSGLYGDVDTVWLTAGGSAFFDQVVEVLGPMSTQGTKVLLRSGAYLIHDDGFYAGISPFSRGVGKPLASAMHGWARVLSRPEATLALLDGGKRDFPFDEGLPMLDPMRGSVTSIVDQHTFVRLDPRSDLAVGDVVRLGLSHPCTAFDKWSLIPVLDDASAADPLVTGLVRTYF
ncbi:alanine racemase [Actinospica sp. MGRD01-02]|uniref:Alanine racemase n=1 Tax=Actinospica acidithermotolerans TaxID=2828514 RepID=A0A941E5L0_9ACTN|nr:alanine racemase [Actinospica acidithermotolerans]MBR7825526.1 alanine racemase [Actinospica acidithermotolerans]